MRKVSIALLLLATATMAFAQLKGTVFAGGVDGMGEIEGHPALQKAYEMGKNV